MAESKTAYELKDIPLVKSVVGVYSRTKSSNFFLTYSCSATEKSLNFLVESIVERTGCGDIADTVVSGFVASLKETYPALQKTPEKIYKKTKRKTSKYIKHGAQTVLRTCAGQTLLAGVDALTNVSDLAYKRLKDQNRAAANMSKSEKHAQTEMMSPTKTSRGQQTKLTGGGEKWVKKLTPEDDQRIQPSFTLSYIVMFPLALLIRFLRVIQRKLHAIADRPSGTRKSSRRKLDRPPLTPEKVEEIECRRKVSPRKRLNSSILGNIKSVAFRMLGLQTSCVKQTDIRQFLTCSKHRTFNMSPLMDSEDAEKKRKHDDILSDDSSTDDEDLVNMDLKNYVSDEDPDYEPTDEDESDSSIDSDEEEDESDFDTVELGEGGLIEIKDKENVTPMKNKSKELEKKPMKENVEKQKELKEKASPKKAVLSPKKQPSSNVQSAIIMNKSPVKQVSGKDEKKDSNHNQKFNDQSKPSESGNKQSNTGSNTANIGNTEKHQGNKKS
ncbi:uncharacterized protein LOC134715597 isoform X1 [Mytilus trossulus]|uniref:uncharacterized protein LOC134715597 isoform X1 n=1 Tax=Mytilus trossulus TaxID=6551 RepID=UPI003004A1AF